MTDSAIIHLPYDLEGLQVGCLIDIPSAFDNTPDRTFRIVELSAIQIYPASIACRIVPEYKNTMERSEVDFFENSNFNLLNEENSRVNQVGEQRPTVNGFGDQLLSDESNGRQIWVK